MSRWWPYRGFIDADLPLTREQRRLAEQRMNEHTKHLPQWTLLILAAVGIALLVFGAPPLGRWIQSLGLRKGLAVTLGTGAMAIGYSAIYIYVFTKLYVPPYRRALRDLGYDICVKCGYWLRGLDDAARNCPECGTPRERMRGDASPVE